MSNEKHSGSGGQKPWTLRASKLLGTSESVVLVLIGVALVLVAVLLLYSGMYDLSQAVRQGPGEIESKAIEILNTVLLVMMTMEIVYTVAISLESHTLNAEPFLPRDTALRQTPRRDIPLTQPGAPEDFSSLCQLSDDQ